MGKVEILKVNKESEISKLTLKVEELREEVHNLEEVYNLENAKERVLKGVLLKDMRLHCMLCLNQKVSD